jgi:two-component system LytT family response regulator
MKEIAALIVDDEPPARRGVRQLLEAHPDISVIGECRDGREALLSLGHLKIDLVFLDVQMPVLDGFGVVRMHGVERMPQVIFVTAYDQFAVRAFEAQAVDYLLKPLNRARFEQAISRVRDRLALLDSREQVRQLTSLLATTKPGNEWLTRIAVPSDRGVVFVEVGAIEWIEAVDYLTRLHTGHASHLLRESLSSLESQLDPEQFVRIHRSAVVRIDCVRELRAEASGDMTVVLRNGPQLPVSRRRRASVRAALTARGAICTAR